MGDYNFPLYSNPSYVKILQYLPLYFPSPSHNFYHLKYGKSAQIQPPLQKCVAAWGKTTDRVSGFYRRNPVSLVDVSAKGGSCAMHVSYKVHPKPIKNQLTPGTKIWKELSFQGGPLPSSRKPLRYCLLGGTMAEKTLRLFSIPSQLLLFHVRFSEACNRVKFISFGYRSISFDKHAQVTQMWSIHQNQSLEYSH